VTIFNTDYYAPLIETLADKAIATFAFILLSLATARLTRLLVNDDWPPSTWFRIKWDTITKDGIWSKIVHCPWCASPYIAAILLAWAVLSNLHWSWWLFTGWLAVSYVASWIVFHDEDPSHDDHDE
jgi:hypothetical protein